MKISVRENKLVDDLRNNIDEALRDEIPDHQKEIVKKRHGEKYLDMDVPTHTENIPNIKEEITDEKLKEKLFTFILENFKKNIKESMFKSDFATLLEKNKTFYEVVVQSLELDKIEVVEEDAFENLKIFYGKNYRMIKERGSHGLVFGNNTTSISKFVINYNKFFHENQVQYEFQKDKTFVGLRDVIMNFKETLLNIKNEKLFLYISDKPVDKLNMSVSKFFDSCQNIYDGSMNDQLLSNVFDKNSKVAYVLYDQPYIDKKGNKHTHTTVMRSIVRDIKGELFIDQTYPQGM